MWSPKRASVCLSSVKSWRREEHIQSTHPHYCFAGCSAAVRASTGSKSTELFTPVKIAFVLLQRPLSRRRRKKTRHPHPPQPTIDTPNEKLGRCWATLGKFITLILWWRAHTHIHTQTRECSFVQVRSLAREQFINHSVKANKLCQSNLTGKLCVGDKCAKATRQFAAVQTSVQVNLSTSAAVISSLALSPKQ